MTVETKIFDLENDGVPIQKDDSAVVLRPNVNAVMMPNEKLNDDESDYLLEVTHALVACFHLMNTDPEFAYKVGEELSKMGIDDEKFEKSENNVIQLSRWTKTEGTA